MTYLLDTHTLLWYFNDSPKLSDDVAQIIEAPDAQKYVSVASFWEFAIKCSLNKLSFSGGIQNFWDITSSNGFQVLPITAPYLCILETLPYYHRDPFDRLIAATAIAEDMVILTADDDIPKYDVKCVW